VVRHITLCRPRGDSGPEWSFQKPCWLLVTRVPQAGASLENVGTTITNPKSCSSSHADRMGKNMSMLLIALESLFELAASLDMLAHR
jgi:hypothetical protein